MKLSELKQEGQKVVNEIKKFRDRDIYKEFCHLQSRIEQLIDEDILVRMDSSEDNFVLYKYIYDCIKEFNEKTNKDKEDVIVLYKKLVIFEISSDIMSDENFEQELFDLYYRGYEKADDIEKKLYDLFGRYYKFVFLKKKISEYSFAFKYKRWDEISSDFVIINDKKLYIDIMEFYERMKEMHDEDIDIQDIYETCIDYHNKIKEILCKLEKHEKRLEKKCK